MGRAKYWDGSRWAEMAPAAQEFDEHVADDARHNSYGTSSTASTTSAKVVTSSGFVLATGVRIAVKFTNGNTTAFPTLNVNSTGAKSIYQNGTVGATWSAREVVEFVYDGTNWNASASPKILLDALSNEKANKTQASWITPVLINGWTTPATRLTRYYKDEFGRVHFEGVISGGTSGAICSMPAGYLPGMTLTTLATMEGTDASLVAGVLVLDTNGLLIHAGDAYTTTYFSFSYRAER